MNNAPTCPTSLDPALSTEGLVELDKVPVFFQAPVWFSFGFYFVDKVLGESCKAEALVEQRSERLLIENNILSVSESGAKVLLDVLI